MPVSRRIAITALLVFLSLLVLLPALAGQSQSLAVIDSFYRVGALVFGGGHVVLPLLQEEVVAPGWVTPDEFLAGYGACATLTSRTCKERASGQHCEPQTHRKL